MNSNRQLENTLRQALARVKQDTKEQDEKRNQKYWSEMNVPFRLDKGLRTYTKYELDAIRRYLKVKNASSLKKAELIERFQEEIPVLLKSVCLQWDEDRLSLLVKMARNGGYLPAPEMENSQIQYLRETGLIFTGSMNGNKVLAVPEELIEGILALEKDQNVRAVSKRNTELIKLTQGLLYYYGTLSVSQTLRLLEKYTKEPVDIPAYNFVIHDAASYNKEIVIDDEGYSHRRVFDPKRVKYEHKARKNVPFYRFSKEQLLEAGEPDFVDRNRSYVQLVNFINQHFETDKLGAEHIVEECVYATKIGQSPNEILQYLSQVLVFENEKTLNLLVDKVVQLMNNTREWFLKGHTSMELRPLDEKSMIPLPTANKNPDSKTTAKIGRNEPCPCGSGKKYKKCCGK